MQTQTMDRGGHLHSLHDILPLPPPPAAEPLTDVAMLTLPPPPRGPRSRTTLAKVCIFLLIYRMYDMFLLIYIKNCYIF